MPLSTMSAASSGGVCFERHLHRLDDRADRLGQASAIWRWVMVIPSARRSSGRGP
jgi:hypothetical protein